MSRGRARSGLLTFLLLIALAGLSFIGGMVAFNFIMAYSVKHGEEITVPQLTGLSLDDAERLAGEVNLPVHQVGERFSASLPTGYILTQDPPQGCSVKVGRRISVIVSGGTETVRLPEVAGKSVRQVIVLLDGAGLEVGDIAQVPSSRVRSGDVIAAGEAEGTIVERGSRVDLLESLGRRSLRYVMPHLVDGDEDLAREYLEHLGLHVFVSRRFDPRGGVGPRVVIAQRPGRGYMVAEGDTVNLTVGVR